MNGGATGRRGLVGITGLLGFLALVVLGGLATGAEPLEDYQDRQNNGSGGSGGDSNGGIASWFADDLDEVEALRVTDDGRLKAVSPGDYQAGDYLVYSGVIRGADVYSADGIAGLEEDRITGMEVGWVDGQFIGLAYDDYEPILELDLIPESDRIRELEAMDAGVEIIEPGDDGAIAVVPASKFTSEQLDRPSSRKVALVGTDDRVIIFGFTPDGIVAVDGGSRGSTGEQLAGRLRDDGEVELVDSDEIRPDDILVEFVPGGFDVIRPDSAVAEFSVERTDDGQDVTAIEILPGGEPEELLPNDDGSFTMTGGTRVVPPDLEEIEQALESGGGPSIWERIADSTDELPWAWIVGGYTALAIASIALSLYLYLTRPPDLFDPAMFGEAPIAFDRFEQLVESLRADPDPARAIRRAFAAVERGFGQLPARRYPETPLEWHQRVAEHPTAGQASQHLPTMAQPNRTFGPLLEPLCNLYIATRFSPNDTTEAERQAMIDALVVLESAAVGSDNGPSDLGSNSDPQLQQHEALAATKR